MWDTQMSQKFVRLLSQWKCTAEASPAESSCWLQSGERVMRWAGSLRFGIVRDTPDTWINDKLIIVFSIFYRKARRKKTHAKLQHIFVHVTMLALSNSLDFSISEDSSSTDRFWEDITSLQRLTAAYPYQTLVSLSSRHLQPNFAS